MEKLKSNLIEFNQEHVLDLLPDLTPESKVFSQLDSIDLKATMDMLEGAKAYQCSAGKPVPLSNSTNWLDMDPSEKESIESIGWEAIATGNVCAVILSGGQGTRLGFAGPKGTFNIGLPSGKSIFQMHFEKLIKISSLASVRARQRTKTWVRVYVMTSYLNDGEIREYFKQNNYFGYDEESIFFFEQGLEPCLSFDGKLMLESSECLVQAPDGNGGIYSALSKTGALADMQARGIEHLHVYGIDNVLTQSCDPGFLGLCIKNNAQVGNKVVWRASKKEKVGVSVEKDRRLEILEYSEIPPELADAVDADGKLTYGAGNICNHYFSLSFVQHVVSNLASIYHLAKKAIPCVVAPGGVAVAPGAPNGYKFELFIFDSFPLADRWAVLEVQRKDEFAPVKNGQGSPCDSPESACSMLYAQSRRWLEAAGAVLVNDSGEAICEGEGAVVEISPLTSYGGEGLEHYSGVTIKTPCTL